MSIHGLERWRQRFAADRQALEGRRQDGLRQAQRAAEVLLAHWPAIRQVRLFGSLLSRGFHEDSDLDLTVEGLPPGAWLQAADLAERAGPLVVDLKRAEDLEPELRQRLLRCARPLLTAQAPSPADESSVAGDDRGAHDAA